MDRSMLMWLFACFGRLVGANQNVTTGYKRRDLDKDSRSLPVFAITVIKSMFFQISAVYKTN